MIRILIAETFGMLQGASLVNCYNMCYLQKLFKLGRGYLFFFIPLNHFTRWHSDNWELLDLALFDYEKAIWITDCILKEASVTLLLQLTLFLLAPFSYPSLGLCSVLASVLLVEISRISPWENSFYLVLSICKLDTLWHLSYRVVT